MSVRMKFNLTSLGLSPTFSINDMKEMMADRLGPDYRVRFAVFDTARVDEVMIISDMVDQDKLIEAVRLAASYVSEVITKDREEKRAAKIEEENLPRVIALETLQGLNAMNDPEAAHSIADKVLCELLWKLGYGDVVQEFEAVDKY